MMEPIVLLGATGSIGRQTLDLLRYSLNYDLVGVSFFSRFEKREPFLLYFPKLKYIGIVDEEKAKEFQKVHPSYKVFSGKNASVEVIKASKNACVFNAIRGNEGLIPSLTSLRLNRDLMLCNKESLVIGSSLIHKERMTSSSHLYPVDSEHVALNKLLNEIKRRKIKENQIRTLWITASGGALRDYPLSDRKKATPERVLKHPTWNRGSKITVDCTTRVNKAFEIREAKALFPRPDFVQYKAVICKESLVHALITFQNEEGKEETIYEYSPVDRKVAIAFALSKGTLLRHENSQEDTENVKKLHFHKIDSLRYPCFSLALERNRLHGNSGRIFRNAVDSLAIQEFLSHKLAYLDIQECLSYTLSHFPQTKELNEENLDSILQQADSFAKEVIDKQKGKTCHSF